MLELAKLYEAFQSRSETARSVEDMTIFGRFNSGYRDSRNRFKQCRKHEQKLLVHTVVVQSIKTLEGYYSETMQDSKEQEQGQFEKAYNHKTIELYQKARATCVTNSLEKARKQSNLPDETALQQLTRKPEALT